MKITFEIQTALLERARRHTQRVGKPLRAIIEEGLRRVLEVEAEPPRYRLPDHSEGEAGAPNPLESLSWQDLRDERSLPPDLRTLRVPDVRSGAVADRMVRVG